MRRHRPFAEDVPFTSRSQLGDIADDKAAALEGGTLSDRLRECPHAANPGGEVRGQLREA